ncbi:MAG: hypothetical protein ACP5MW_00515, partial [Thermoplasmata archaeon]
YGHDDKSNYSKYTYHRTGLLETIPSIRYEGGIIMIRKEDLDKVVTLLNKYKAKYVTWEVIPNENEQKQLQLEGI